MLQTDCPWVVATLDVNIGTKLKAEELIGREPRVTEAAHKRAYLSNVCVLPAARRRGLAKKLINAACDLVSIEYGVQVNNCPPKDRIFVPFLVSFCVACTK